MFPLISVIVPVYNVERYLRKCVDSIINQTYRNLEIILVDDGSPDRCPALCDEYAGRDSRIRVVHKENGGLSDARNAGMKQAAGEYVSFIDSDDYIAPEFYETLLAAIKKNNSDIAECNSVKVFENGAQPPQNDNLSETSYAAEEALAMLICDYEFHQHVWNKLYSAEAALKIPFEKGRLNEDEFWTYQVFGAAARVTKVNKTMYFYLQRPDSIMGSGFSLKRLDALEGKSRRQEYLEESFPRLAARARVNLLFNCIFMGQSAMKFLSGGERQTAMRVITDYYNRYMLSGVEMRSLNSKKRHWLAFAKHNFRLCCRVREIMGVGF